MEDANKILDVTYGSFSCRLEGFEDSVETMKTVVMYFHDLAGHDRFMDMEPQAPDLDELARLTEEQTGVAVELEGEGQRVSLRAGPAIAAVVDEEDDLAAELESLEEEDWDEDTAETMEEVAAEEDLDMDDGDGDEVAMEEDAVEETVADRLRRIRDSVEERASEETGDADDAEMEAGGAAAALGVGAFAAASQLTQPEATDADDGAPDEVAEDATADDMAHHDPTQVEEAAEIDQAEIDADIAMAEMAEAPDEDIEAAYGDVDADSYSEDEVAAEEAVAESEEPAEEHLLDDDAHADAEDDVAAETVEEPAEPTEEVVEEPAGGPLVLTSRDAAVAGEVKPEDDDDDFDLQAEVAKIEAELAARKGNSEARHGLPRSVDDAMSRILSQTDQHLNQPESRRHRDAFAQLKAAVAATEAARQLGDAGEQPEDPDVAYKDDLGAHEAEERANAEAAAAPKAPPLKLVQTKILDEPLEAPAQAQAPSQPAVSQPGDAASMRLREIAARKENASTPHSAVDFKAFAESQGAVEIIDMIEAAAAYMYYVEGDADFSRPQVMKKVQSATGAEISREDGLRAFGRLLRLAKIVKLSNGRFRISDNSEYRPDDAQAAQG